MKFQLLFLLTITGIVPGRAQPFTELGTDRRVYLPYNKCWISAEVSNEVVSSEWTLSDTMHAAFENKDTDQATIIFSADGVYTLKHKVLNASNDSAVDEITIDVRFAGSSDPMPTDRGRIQVFNGPYGKTLVGDDNQRLRGNALWYTGGISETPNQVFWDNPAYYKDLRNNGLNIVRVGLADAYWFTHGDVRGDLGLLSRPEVVDRIIRELDTVVNICSRYGMYVILNYHNPGMYDSDVPEFRDHMEQMWSFIARRYRDRTHVIYEIMNEPVMGSDHFPDYPIMVDNIAMYNMIRSLAPESHIMLFSFQTNCDDSYTMLDAAAEIDSQIMIDWTKTSVAFHGYFSWDSGGDFPTVCHNTDNVLAIMAKYPVMVTEYSTPSTDENTFSDTEKYAMQSLERIGVSWIGWYIEGPEFYSNYLPVLADARAKDYIWDYETVEFNEPVVSLPSSLSLFLPEGVSALIAANTSDDDAVVYRYWKMVKSTMQSEVLLQQNGSDTLIMSNLSLGTCFIRLYAWDNEGYSAYDEMKVIVSQPFNLTGRLEAENYTDMYGVDTEPSEDPEDIIPGLNVGWMEEGDWMEYRLDVPEGGEYLVKLRVAADIGFGSSAYFKVDCEVASPEFKVTATGGWQTWKSVYTSLNLTAGLHTLRLCTAGGFNLNWMEFVPVSPCLDCTGIVSAGDDVTITLPTTRANLQSETTQPEEMAYYYWRLISSPGGSQIKMDNNQLPAVKVSNLNKTGYYHFELSAYTVTGQKITDEAVIEVKNATLAGTIGIQDFRIFPNPVSDQLHIHFTQALSQPLEISLSDMTGRIGMKRMLFPGVTLYDLDVSVLSGGYYTLRFKNEVTSLSRVILVW